MIYVYVAILAGYLVMFLLSLGEKGNPFQKMAARIFWKRQKRQKRANKGRGDWKRALYIRQLGDKLKTLQPEIAAEKQIREHYLSLYTLLLTVVFVGDVFCLAAWFSAHSAAKLIDGVYLSRNAYGEGDVEVGLKAEIPGVQEEIFDYLLEERGSRKKSWRKAIQRRRRCFRRRFLTEMPVWKTCAKIWIWFRRWKGILFRLAGRATPTPSSIRTAQYRMRSLSAVKSLL